MSEFDFPPVPPQSSPQDVSFDLSGTPASQVLIATRVDGDPARRFTISAGGTLSWGDGTNSPDVAMARNAAGSLSITGVTGGPQLRMIYDATWYVDFQVTPWVAGAGTLFSIIPKTKAFPNAFCQWIMQGSDFCMSYEGDSVNGQGVPNFTIRGPASSGYAASSGPGFNLYNNASVLNGKLWAMYLNDQVLTFQLINDANNSTNNWMTVTRSALVLTNITLGTHLYSGSDGNLDLGQTANRWKAVYFATQAIGPQGALATPTYTFTGATTYGLYFASGIGPALQYNSSLRAAANSSGWGIYNAGTLQFSGGTGAPDTFIARDAANIISILNANAAQAFRVYAGNGDNLGIVTVNETLTIAAAATTVAVTSIPAGAILLAVSVRVTTVIPTAVTFAYATTVGGTTLNTAAVSSAANSTDPGTAAGASYRAAATTVTITPNLTPGAATGVVRLCYKYLLSTPPTS